MKNIAFIFSSLVAALAFVSCSQENVLPDGQDDVHATANRRISIKASIPKAGSRGITNNGEKQLDYFVVTCFNANYPGQNQGFEPMFLTEKFEPLEDEGVYSNPEILWPDQDSPYSGTESLMFFAHYPALENVAYINNSVYESPENFTVNYSISGFEVKTDISQQIDFMTAYVSAHNPTTPEKNIVPDTLAFHHQLGAIEIKAQGVNREYDIEIAGVGIGNAIVKGNFIYLTRLDNDGKVTSVGSWQSNYYAVNEKFIQCKEPGFVQYIFREEEPVKVSENPASIMGESGYAMIIPNRCKAWDNKGNPEANSIDDKGNPIDPGSYFAALIRVTEKDNPENIVYPYPSKEKMPVGYTFEGREKVTIGGKDFGWAAIPVKSEWNAGKKYSYTLHFDKGIGVLPPDDPNPGKPIIANDHIVISLNVYDWINEDVTLIPDFDFGNNSDNESGNESGNESK